MTSHRALQISDILLAILAQFPFRGDGLQDDVRTRNRREVTKLALVSKAFLDPALSSLWRELDNMLPLFKLLSCFKQSSSPDPETHTHSGVFDDEDNLYHETRTVSDTSDGSHRPEPEHPCTWILQGDICPAEWERFQQYAKRVRSVRYNEDKDGVEPSIFVSLSRYNNGKPIVPELRKLECTELSAGGTSLFSLISSSTRDLSVGFYETVVQHDYPTMQDAECVLGNLLRHIFSVAPELEHLSIRNISRTSPLETGALLCLAAFGKLRRLHITDALHAVDPPSLRAIAGLRNLADLSIALEVGDIPICDGFSRLEKLSITGYQPIILRSLHALSLPLLRSLSLLYGDKEYNTIVCKEIVNSLALCTKFPALCSLKVFIPCRRRWTQDRSLELANLIRPIFVLGQLENIDLDFFDLKLLLPDEDFRQVAYAWPRVKRFTLRCEVDGSVPSISALAHFAQHCLSLKTLSLPGVKDDPSVSLETLPMMSHGLRELGFMYAPEVTNVHRFAQIIARLFPILGTDYVSPTTAVFPNRHTWVRWRTVLDIVDELQSSMEAQASAGNLPDAQ